MTDINDLLKAAQKQNASDILISPGEPPVFRTAGVLTRVPGQDALTPETSKAMVYGMLSDAQRSRFEASSELDCSFALAGVARFRANVYVDKDGVCAALRLVPNNVPTTQELGLPPNVIALTKLPRGLVLVTGPTGSGKTTTLASLIETINQTHERHIVTIEDPIEFSFADKKSVINQREIGTHSRSFGVALRQSLRQNPDVIMIGELRDLETISLALTAAETGHLCFATLHTKDAASTVDRMVDVFPPEQQQQVRVQLADVLTAVVAQALLPRKGGGLVCAREIMLMTPGIGNLIRDGKTAEIRDAVQSGAAKGMVTLDQHLAMLVRSNQVLAEDAFAVARTPGDLQSMLASQGV